MPLYKIGHKTCEEEEYVPFFFDKELTKEELADYVHKATANALKYAIEHKTYFGGLDGPSVSDLFPRIVEELQLFGFEPTVYCAEYSCFGWGSVCKDNWSEHRGEEDKRLIESIPEELRQKALEITREIHEKADVPGFTGLEKEIFEFQMENHMGNINSEEAKQKGKELWEKAWHCFYDIEAARKGRDNDYLQKQLETVLEFKTSLQMFVGPETPPPENPHEQKQTESQ